MRRMVLAILAAGLLAGCETKEVRHIRSGAPERIVYETPRPAQEAYHLAAGEFRSFGWGETFDVHEEWDPQAQKGSLWVSPDDPRWLNGFLVDVTAGPDGGSCIIIYPVNRYWARRSRVWFAEKLARPLRVETESSKR